MLGTEESLETDKENKEKRNDIKSTKPTVREWIERNAVKVERMTTKFPRDVLRKEWFMKKDLGELQILIIDRLAPGEETEINGRQILDLGKSFFSMSKKKHNVSIPYHRIKKITRNGEILWERK